MMNENLKCLYPTHIVRILTQRQKLNIRFRNRQTTLRYQSNKTRRMRYRTKDHLLRRLDLRVQNLHKMTDFMTKRYKIDNPVKKLSLVNHKSCIFFHSTPPATTNPAKSPSGTHPPSYLTIPLPHPHTGRQAHLLHFVGLHIDTPYPKTQLSDQDGPNPPPFIRPKKASSPSPSNPNFLTKHHSTCHPLKDKP